MTQLSPSTESFGVGDQSWLGSRHGTETPKSVTFAPAAWSAKVADGRVKSGEPFALVSGLAVPYDATDGSGSGPAATLAGFLFTDQSVTSTRGNVTAPAIWHGRIILSKLPSTVTAAAKTSGLFVWEA